MSCSFKSAPSNDLLLMQANPCLTLYMGKLTERRQGFFYSHTDRKADSTQISQTRKSMCSLGIALPFSHISHGGSFLLDLVWMGRRSGRKSAGRRRHASFIRSGHYYHLAMKYPIPKVHVLKTWSLVHDATGRWQKLKRRGLRNDVRRWGCLLEGDVGTPVPSHISLFTSKPLRLPLYCLTTGPKTMGVKLLDQWTK